jgi:predicted alpha/beta hydrolase family esterase
MSTPIKQAILLHGTGGSDTDYFWFGDTKQYLEQNGYEVWWPMLPNTDKPNLAETRSYIEENMPSVNEETIIIAHSSACPMILHLLESFQVKVSQVVLVAGYYQSISDESTSMLPPKGFDWEQIKPKVDEFIFINSDNDPWKCTDDQARIAAQALESPLIVNFGQGHMGSGTFNQPYREFGLLKRLLRIKAA